eukprot:900614-Pyramimonas_sp.AAC.1
MFGPPAGAARAESDQRQRPFRPPLDVPAPPDTSTGGEGAGEKKAQSRDNHLRAQPLEARTRARGAG